MIESKGQGIREGMVRMLHPERGFYMPIEPPVPVAGNTATASPFPRLTIIAFTAVAAIMLTVAYCFFGPFRHGIDDADITMIYARNIAEGHGYVYEPGGERVEGSTSLLWTLICAGLYYLGFTGMSAVVIAGLLLTALTIYVGLELARSSSVPQLGNASVLVAAACFALSPSFLAWSAATLMDTAVWTTCVTVGVATALSFRQGGAWRLALVGLLLVAARPEGIVVAPLILMCALFASVARGGTAVKVARGLALPAIIILAAFLGLVAIRLAYFGFPLPNTYYAKVGTHQLQTSLSGLSYLVKALGKQPLLLLALCAIVYVLANDVRRLWSDTASARSLDEHAVTRIVLASVLVVGAALPIVEGADHFPGGRLLQPFVPLACALVAACFARMLQSRRRFALSGLLPALAVLGALGWFRFIKVDTPRLKSEFAIASEGREIGRLLIELLDSGKRYPSIGVTAAGGIAYVYPGHVYDLLGLNWVAMAHASRDRDGIPGHSAFVATLFWQRTPDFIGLDIQTKRPRDACDAYSWTVVWTDRFLRGLLSADTFRQQYVGFALPAHDRYLTGFALRKWTTDTLPVGASLLPWPADSVRRQNCSLTTTDLDHD